MPLVGVDWSHLGVAHLFSAIKVVYFWVFNIVYQKMFRLHI